MTASDRKSIGGVVVAAALILLIATAILGVYVVAAAMAGLLIGCRLAVWVERPR